MHAEVISLGAELMTGAAVDTNSAWLSEALACCGVPVRRHTTVGDDRSAITAVLRETADRVELVVVTGGLGPTADDLTRHALADALGVPLVTDTESLGQIEAFFRKLNRPMPEGNRVQAELPRGCVVLPNEWGTAPGIEARFGRATVFCLPGVPREMQALFGRYIVPFIDRHAPPRGINTRVLRTFGAGESNLAEQIADLMTPGRNPAVGTTASEGVISVRIVARAESRSAAAQLADADEAEVRRRLGPLVYGHDDDTLASVVGAQLAERGLTVATAESCTAGLIAKMLTDVAGSSRYVLGGIITYSNALKTVLLNVPAQLIESHGAVSEQVARVMAENCRTLFECDFALSVTGIAGPGGGTATKPVGLVHVGLASPRETVVRECRFSDRFSRDAIRDRSAKTALNMLRRELMR
jgi:nicotinamide-nucleotide amidase